MLNLLKKPMSYFGALGAVLLLTACGSVEVEDVTVEMAVPEDSPLMFVFDHTDQEQIAAFDALVERFPETGLYEEILGFFELEYLRDLGEFLDGEWKFAFAAKFNKDLSEIEYSEDASMDDISAYLVFQITEADEFERFFIDVILEEYIEGLAHKDKGDYELWTDEETEFYLLRYGDLFLLTNTEKNRNLAVSGLKKGVGFDSSKVLGLEESGLGYMYMDFSMIVPAGGAAYEEIGLSNLAAVFDGVGEVYATWKADDDGIYSVSNSEISNEASATVFGVVPEGEYELNFAERINADGVIGYSEQARLGSFLEAFIYGFWIGYSGGQSDVEIDVLESPESYESYEDFLAWLAETGGMSVDELEAVFDSPFAFVLSDSGGYLPAMAFYLDLEANAVESAKRLANAIDTYIDTMIVEFDRLVVENGAPDLAGIAKRDTVAVGGGGLHRVYVENLGALVAGYVPIPLDPEKLKFELYYGVTGDGVLVFALYPGFAEAYGKNVLTEDADYLEALDRVGGEAGYAVTYFKTQSFIDWLGRFVELGRSLGFVSDDIWEQYDLYANQFAPTFKYTVEASSYEDGLLRTEGYVRIE